MPIPSGWELVLILVVVLVLFGAKRMPDAARSLGRSMRILKAETKGLRDDDKDHAVAASGDSTVRLEAHGSTVIPDPTPVAPPAHVAAPTQVAGPSPLPGTPPPPGIGTPLNGTPHDQVQQRQR